MRLAVPSPALIQLLETAESLFRANSDALIQNHITLAQIGAFALQGVMAVNCFPECHKVADRILRVFLRTKMHILLGKQNQRADEN